jgi:hypothetical protein
MVRHQEVDQAVPPCSSIGEVLVSNLGWDTGYSDIIHDFPQPLQKLDGTSGYDNFPPKIL